LSPSGARNGEEAIVHPCDIRNIKTLQAAIEQTRKRLGDIGVLVNNAANDDRHSVRKVTVEYWDERMALDLRPMFFAAQAVLPQMKRAASPAITLSRRRSMAGAQCTYRSS
jgi:D-xylose 1-dehydrogenase